MIFLAYFKWHILPTPYARKRMSVVVQEDDGIYCYTKGADTTVMEVISPNNEKSIVEKTQKSLNEFAEDGLRTLLLGYKKISNSEWEQWQKKYHEGMG